MCILELAVIVSASGSGAQEKLIRLAWGRWQIGNSRKGAETLVAREKCAGWLGSGRRKAERLSGGCR